MSSLIESPVPVAPYEWTPVGAAAVVVVVVVVVVVAVAVVVIVGVVLEPG